MKRLYLMLFVFCIGHPWIQVSAGAVGIVDDPDRRKVCIEDVCVSAIVADTPELQQKGLMFRSTLPEGQGMLFVYDRPGRYSFWMKNMHFSLDIIWIDDTLRVSEIMRGVPPCPPEGRCEPFAPHIPAQFILEVPAGFVDTYNVHQGSRVSIEESDEVYK